MNSLKEYGLKDSAYYMWDGGWRAEDKALIIEEYSIPEEDADVICEALRDISETRYKEMMERLTDQVEWFEFFDERYDPLSAEEVAEMWLDAVNHNVEVPYDENCDEGDISQLCTDFYQECHNAAYNHYRHVLPCWGEEVHVYVRQRGEEE